MITLLKYFVDTLFPQDLRTWAKSNFIPWVILWIAIWSVFSLLVLKPYLK